MYLNRNVKCKTKLSHCQNNYKIKYQKSYEETKTQIHDHTLPGIGTETSTKLVLWTSPLSEMMR